MQAENHRLLGCNDFGFQAIVTPLIHHDLGLLLASVGLPTIKPTSSTKDQCILGDGVEMLHNEDRSCTSLDDDDEECFSI